MKYKNTDIKTRDITESKEQPFILEFSKKTFKK